MDSTITRTLDALRRVRDARQRKAAIEKVRQERVAARTAQDVVDAQTRMMREIAARLALAQRIDRDSGSSAVTPRSLADMFFEDMSRTRAAGLARLDVMRAGEVHRREEATLDELRQQLGRAQANLDKIDRVAGEVDRAAQRRADAREDDEADAAALRGRGHAAGTAGEPVTPHAAHAASQRRDGNRS
ncbi:MULTISPECIES: hypothetical protein [Paraburkholderia]|uniref:hypothetical protein n=1 Tax=Paraburkholderia TaxID=1822464 RepID=UPI00225A4C70|nr:MULTISPECIES: hypothetical protein [Paraburkholderia]MCX4161464.1 hypothetical protein [Paraburkholderia megapolitana]MDN7156960.1 hypothetical protein [Paraburkholderia sp. CHISQ3]MDQ6494005.1 hypothetical protein [Paraburkholderia megapolitana]